MRQVVEFHTVAGAEQAHVRVVALAELYLEIAVGLHVHDERMPLVAVHAVRDDLHE